MTNVPIMNRLAWLASNVNRPNLTYVELGQMAFDVGFSTPGFAHKIQDLINSDAVYDSETDRIVSFQLRLFCEDEEEPFVDEHMVLNLAFVGFLAKSAINENKTIADKFVEFIMDKIENGS